ncbi:MAG TPA: hypothetical protein VG733_10855 [Chthoniobacteraceae bacterium]|nr:hypothetical protein [Chthoniobacteraceae bacterium]
MAPTKEYQRLPGRSGFLIWGSRLYMARDHLLRISSNGWTENYRRFYFSDVQLIMVNPTNGQGFWIALHFVFCALFALCILGTDNTSLRIMWGAIALFFAVKMLLNFIGGPMCTTQIRTRIGVERLPSLKRMRNLRKVLATLRPLIDAAQGGLAAEDVPQRVAELQAHQAARQSYQASYQYAPAASAFAPSTVPEKRYNSYRGAAHGWNFGVFLLLAAAWALNVLSPGIPAATFVVVTTLAATGLTITALAKQGRSILEGPVRTVTWFGLGHVIISFVCGFVMMVAATVDDPAISNDQHAVMIAASKMHGPVVDGFYFFMAAYAAAVGIAGVITFMGARRNMEAALQAEASVSQP